MKLVSMCAIAVYWACRFIAVEGLRLGLMGWSLLPNALRSNVLPRLLLPS